MSLHIRFSVFIFTLIHPMTPFHFPLWPTRSVTGKISFIVYLLLQTETCIFCHDCCFADLLSGGCTLHIPPTVEFSGCMLLTATQIIHPNNHQCWFSYSQMALKAAQQSFYIFLVHLPLHVQRNYFNPSSPSIFSISLKVTVISVSFTFWVYS